jgi:hypothetical protein
MLQEFSSFLLPKVATSFVGSRHTHENVVCIHKKGSLNCHHILVIFGIFKH